MAENGSPVPAMVRHYAAYLQAKAHITPETRVNGATEAEIRISVGERCVLLAQQIPVPAPISRTR